ncbi:hypothetical protein HYW84_01305 [Candidatus Peregrinibacteria bacterium]|nr:hypothetical protein [Candidatus Peregrinibacteria bacterium]
MNTSASRHDRITEELKRIDALELMPPIEGNVKMVSEQTRVSFGELLLQSHAKFICGLCEKNGEQWTVKILTGVAYQKYWDMIEKARLTHKGFGVVDKFLG